MKKVVVSVTNDLSSDQRVHKICTSLYKNNYDVLLIGRKLKNSKIVSRKYSTKRFNLIFNSSFLFYAEYNIRLFFYLLFIKKHILVANDLDTLFANYLASKLSKSKLVYDSHELFTEVPELTNRPLIRKVWLTIEQWIFPKLKYVYTVNYKIAEIYTKKYNVNVGVIKNASPYIPALKINKNFSKEIKGNNTMLILQGNGINVDRGAEEAVKMMCYLQNTILYIIGNGDVFPKLKQLITDLKLTKKVKIIDSLPYYELLQYTSISDLGLSLDKNSNLNYKYSLPNKLFDYIQTRTPIIASNTQLVSEIVSKHNIGAILPSYNPKEMATTIDNILQNKTQLQLWQHNLQDVAKKLNWEFEERNLLKIYSEII